MVPINGLVALVADIASSTIRVNHIPGPPGSRSPTADSCSGSGGSLITFRSAKCPASNPSRRSAGPASPRLETLFSWRRRRRRRGPRRRDGAPPAGFADAGHETPPFRALSSDEVDAMRARLRTFGAQVAWIGLGAPKQELFMADHVGHLPGLIAMDVGAAFDVDTGRVRRAPPAFQALGLEWFCRLALETRRLWSRYSVAIPRFLCIAAASLLSRSRGTA